MNKREPYGQGDLVGFLEREVFPSLFSRLASAFPEFGFKQKGRFWEATNEGHTKAYFAARPGRVLAYENTPFGFQIHGGEFVSWLAYVAGGTTPRGKEFVAAVRKLADLAGVPFPEREWTPAEREQAEKRERRGSLLEAFLAVSKAALLNDKGKDARAYLVEKRGFDGTSLAFLEFGFYSTPADVKAALVQKGFPADEVDASGLTYDARWTGRLVLPLRDERGMIGTFAARDLTGKAEDEAKYLYLKDGKKPVAAGLDRALRSPDGRRSLVLVEGILDAVSLPLRGLVNVAALGGDGRLLSAERWERLAALGVREVVLALDNDEAGKAGTVAALENATKGRKVPVLYVLDPVDLGDVKDPDEFVRKHGVEAFGKLLERRKPGAVYAGLAFLEGITPKSEAHERREAVEKVVGYVSGLRGDRAALDHEDLLSLAVERTGYTFEALADMAEVHEKRRRREDAEREVDALLQEAQAKRQGKTDVFGLARDLAKKAASIEAVALDEPPPFSVERLDKESREVPQGLSSGWSALDVAEVFFNPGELAVLGARTSHCKTSVLVALLANWLMNNEPGKFVLYSLEEPEVRIYHRLLAFITKEIVDVAGRNGLALTASEIRDFYRKGLEKTWQEDPQRLLEQAKEKLRSWEDRLLVVYRPSWTIDALAAHARDLAEKEPVGAVLVDYLQRVAPPAGSYDRRDIEVSAVARSLKRLAVDLSAPVVVGAQINREAVPPTYREKLAGKSYEDAKAEIEKARPELHHLREGGSEQEADLVLGLLNYAADYRGDEPLPPEKVTRLEVGTLKNRYGVPGRWFALAFAGRYGYIRDPRGDEI